MKIDPKDVTVMFGDIVCSGFVDLPVVVHVKPYRLVPAWVLDSAVRLLRLHNIDPTSRVCLVVKEGCLMFTVLLPKPVDFVELTGTVST